MSANEQSAEEGTRRDKPGLWVQVKMFGPDGFEKTEFVNPHRIHINAGTYKFTLRITPEGLHVSTRVGLLEINPKGANLILIKETD